MLNYTIKFLGYVYLLQYSFETLYTYIYIFLTKDKNRNLQSILPKLIFYNLKNIFTLISVAIFNIIFQL